MEQKGFLISNPFQFQGKLIGNTFANSLLNKKMDKGFVSEGNGLYKKGVAVLNAANEKVNSGALKTTDAAYSAEVDKAKEKVDEAAKETVEKTTKTRKKTAKTA